MEDKKIFVDNEIKRVLYKYCKTFALLEDRANNLNVEERPIIPEILHNTIPLSSLVHDFGEMNEVLDISDRSEELYRSGFSSFHSNRSFTGENLHIVIPTRYLSVDDGYRIMRKDADRICAEIDQAEERVQTRRLKEIPVLKHSSLSYRTHKKSLQKMAGFWVLPYAVRIGREPMPASPVPFRGYLLWWTGVCRVHEDGDGWAAVFRPWHPLTWVVFLVMIPICALVGEPIFEVVPMRVNPYFREYPEKLIWWSPFSKRQGAVCQLHDSESNG